MFSNGSSLDNARFNGVVVPEIAREYLAGRSGYAEQDLLEIARRQVSAEATARVATEGLVVCDTDLTVIQVWWEEKFGELPPQLARELEQREPRIYLLTAPDLEWEADPLRENPQDRQRLFDRYRELLEESGFGYGVVAGIGNARLRSAISVIRDVAGRRAGS